MSDQIPEEQLDELTEDESNLSEENGNEPSRERRRIFTDKLDPPIDSLYMKYKRGDLILDPIFQRRPVWISPAAVG
jgi:phosphoenolpyruvate synthase/pyruvate phosphate dikinase